MTMMRGTAGALLAVTLSALGASVQAQTRPAPVQDPVATMKGGRPIPGPVYETRNFTRAVDRGTRDRNGLPGKSNWTQFARYDIDARLDPSKQRLTGRERVTYLNRSPDTLHAVPIYLRQNLFAPGSPRREPVPITGGVTLTRVEAQGMTLARRQARFRQRAASLRGATAPSCGSGWHGRILPRRQRAPSPSNGRSRRRHHHRTVARGARTTSTSSATGIPQVAVYDDVNGWVTDPYINGAEFYMDMADYDVRVTVPRGWVVGATGTLRDSASVLTPRTMERLAVDPRQPEVAHVIAPADLGTGNALRDEGLDLHLALHRDPGARLLLGHRQPLPVGRHHRPWCRTARAAAPTRSPSTASSALSAAAAAWPLGGARFTRDAIEQLSAWLWPYPWPQMTSMEGVLTERWHGVPDDDADAAVGRTPCHSPATSCTRPGTCGSPCRSGSNETRHAWMDEGLTQFNTAQAMRVLYGEPRSGGRPNDTEQGQRAQLHPRRPERQRCRAHDVERPLPAQPLLRSRTTTRRRRCSWRCAACWATRPSIAR